MKKTILLAAMFMMVFLLFGTAWAKQPAAPPPPVCGGLTGTWHGQESGDMRWLAIHTSDSLDPTKGEMLMNWIWVNPNLIGLGNTLTPGHGIWQLKSDGMYDYTWYAYVVGSDGILGTIRVSGVAIFQNPFDPDATADCNTVTIYYEFDFAAGEVPVGGLGGTDTFSPFTSGVAYETRAPMVVTPLPQ